MELLKSILQKNISLSDILDSLTEGVIIIDLEKKILFLNSPGKTILRPDIRSHLDENWSNDLGIYHLNQTQSLRLEEMPIIQSLKGKLIKNYRLYLRHPDSMEGQYVSVDSTPLKTEDGQIVGAMATYRNITATVLREREILEERAFYQRLLDFIPAFILIKSIDGKYIFANKFIKEAFPERNFLGHTAAEVLPEKAQEFEEEDQLVKTNRKDIENLIEIQDGSGQFRLLRTIRFASLDNEGNINAICMIAFDETDKIENKKKIERERIKSINASKLAALGSLAAEIGHEINNPLGIIKTSIAVLRMMINESVPGEILHNQINMIDETSNRIIEIVSALKHVSRDSSNETLSSCKIEEILNDVKALCSTKFKLKNIKLTFDTSKVNITEQVFTLRIQISQVLLNLLANAADATEGLKNPWVKVELTEDSHFFFFQVTDSGPGVPEEIRKRLFEPFFTTKEIGQGTGLGLSISSEIMKRQAGDLYLDPTQGPNCFVVKLRKKKW